MKRCFIIFICMIFMSGCINKSDISENESNMSSQSSNDDYGIPSLFYGVISIHDLNDNIVDTPVIKYEGQRMSYKLFTNIVQSKENGPEYFNRTFFILVNGNLQPFYFENSKDEVLYAQLDGDTNKDFSYEFSFDPIYVPYGENTVISFIISNSPKYVPQNNTEQILSSSMEQNYCLTASLEKYKVDNNLEEQNNKSKIIEESYNDIQTPGILLTEKIVDLNQFKLNNMFEGQKQLYATLSLSEDTDIRVLTIMDGKISDIFNGENSIDLHVQPGKIYEVPLSLKNLKEETHQISFVMINLDEMNFIKMCSTGNQIMSHTITSMQYTYYLNVEKQ